MVGFLEQSHDINIKRPGHLQPLQRQPRQQLGGVDLRLQYRQQPAGCVWRWRHLLEEQPIRRKPGIRQSLRDCSRVCAANSTARRAYEGAEKQRVFLWGGGGVVQPLRAQGAGVDLHIQPGLGAAGSGHHFGDFRQWGCVRGARHSCRAGIGVSELKPAGDARHHRLALLCQWGLYWYLVDERLVSLLR
jgi:hypothetical protein